jgi:hypothetical protein
VFSTNAPVKVNIRAYLNFENQRSDSGRKGGEVEALAIRVCSPPLAPFFQSPPPNFQRLNRLCSDKVEN